MKIVLLVPLLAMSSLFCFESREVKYQKVETVFDGRDFNSEVLPSFSLLFPLFPKASNELSFPIYGVRDERGMEFLVTVFPLKDLLINVSFLKVTDIDLRTLLDAWLKKERRRGEVVKVYNRVVKNFPFEAYDVLFCNPDGIAVRARFIYAHEFLFVLCTKVTDPIYKESVLEEKSEAFNLYKRDYRRSRDFFTSFSFF